MLNIIVTGRKGLNVVTRTFQEWASAGDYIRTLKFQDYDVEVA